MNFLKKQEDSIKIKYFLRKLPLNIIKLIYFEYVKPDLICIELKIILNSLESKNLNYYPLYNYLHVVLKNKIVINYNEEKLTLLAVRHMITGKFSVLA